ncbi:MAG TPA: S41 family peptidase [Flavipsychrobacter sp.]|nr:S41 family peptidase [Flavipsychrobacter sp.]
MDGKQSGGFKVWTPLFFSVVMVGGMALGFNLRDTLRGKRDIQAVMQRNDRLEQIIDLINEKYVDSVKTDELYKGAIEGILSDLDPHTSYIPADELEEVNEDLEGSFYGIGVEFYIFDDTMNVTAVVPGGPADKAGVITGDKIIKVGDSVIAGRQIPSDNVIKMLKGRLNSKVSVMLKDPVSNAMKQLTIARGEIPVVSVDANIMLDSKTGYIKINRFSATTYDEFARALKGLKANGMEQLVIDLRQNPGGYLEAAQRIADELLEGDKLIVYTKGIHSKRIDYKTEGLQGFEKGKIAILIDEGSASASEILSGAVQDYDRGIIVGRRSYGKGLVQEQYDLDDGAALRLTVAKYYIPSGRCIQRSYKNGRDAYDEDFMRRFENDVLNGNDSIITDDTARYYTANKRVVYGGGGIKPDVFVPFDTARLTPGLTNMLYSEDARRTVWNYYMHHRAQLLQYKTITDFSTKYGGDELVTGFLKMQDPTFRRAVERVLRNQTNLSYFRLQLKAQLARILFRSNGYYSITTWDDAVIRKAMETMNSTRYSAIIGRQGF